MVPTPAMEKLVFTAKMAGNMDQIKERLKSVPSYAVNLENEVLTVAVVESRNIKKMPYLFYVIEIKENEFVASYSIPREMSQNMRRAVMLKNVAALASLVSDLYFLDRGKLLQYVDSTMDNILKGLSQPYSALFNQYNSMLNEYIGLKKLNKELTASNRNLTVQATQFNEQNKKMADELGKLRKYSDESLMAMIQDWIEVHNSAIDLADFAKTYGVAQPRIEEVLNKMVSLGYLELKG